MFRQTTRRSTQRRRCWLEQCEVRQMLSVAPMQSPQATLVTQSLAMQLSASRVTSELTVTGNIGGALLSSTGGQFSFTIKNSFGDIVIPQGTINGLFPIAPDAVGELDVEPWRVYQPPSIDPIPPAPINQPPADPIAVLDPISVGPIAMPAPVSAPQPISASDPISPPPIASGPDPSSYLQRFVPPTTSAPTGQVCARARARSDLRCAAGHRGRAKSDGHAAERRDGR